MKKEQIVGTRLPDTVVRDLEAIEEVEQSDRSTTVRKTSVSGDKDLEAGPLFAAVWQRQAHTCTCRP